MTVGEGTAAAPAREIELAALRELEPSLPVAFRVREVSLLVESADGTWSCARRFPLAA